MSAYAPGIFGMRYVPSRGHTTAHALGDYTYGRDVQVLGALRDRFGQEITSGAARDWKASVRAYLNVTGAGIYPAIGVDITAAGSKSTKTLSKSANGAISADAVWFDDLTLVLGDRVLVNRDDSVATVHHGIYEVIDEGSVATPWVLRRAADADGNADGEVSYGMYVYVEEGAAFPIGPPTGTFGERAYAVTASGSGDIDVDVDAFVLTQVSGTGAYITELTAGAGITLVDAVNGAGPITTAGSVTVDQSFAPTWTGQHDYQLPIYTAGIDARPLAPGPFNVGDTYATHVYLGALGVPSTAQDDFTVVGDLLTDSIDARPTATDMTIGASTATSVAVGSGTMAGDISLTTSTASIVLDQSENEIDVSGHIEADDGISAPVFTHARSVGPSIAVGKVVSLAGATGGQPRAELSDRTATGQTARPHGIATETLTAAAGEIVTQGIYTFADGELAVPGAATAGSTLYLSTAGTLTDVIPGGQGTIFQVGQILTTDGPVNWIRKFNVSIHDDESYQAARVGVDYEVRLSTGNQFVVEDDGDVALVTVDEATGDMDLITGDLTLTAGYLRGLAVRPFWVRIWNTTTAGSGYTQTLFYKESTFTNLLSSGSGAALPSFLTATNYSTITSPRATMLGDTTPDHTYITAVGTDLLLEGVLYVYIRAVSQTRPAVPRLMRTITGTPVQVQKWYGSEVLSGQNDYSQVVFRFWLTSGETYALDFNDLSAASGYGTANSATGTGTDYTSCGGFLTVRPI